jgi:hypothetical protein
MGFVLQWCSMFCAAFNLLVVVVEVLHFMILAVLAGACSCFLMVCSDVVFCQVWWSCRSRRVDVSVLPARIAAK